MADPRSPSVGVALWYNTHMNTYKIVVAQLCRGVAFPVLFAAGKPLELKNAVFEQVDKRGYPVGWSRHPNWHGEKAGHNGSGGFVFEYFRK